MRKSTAIRTAIIGGVAAAGLAVGGVAIASADPATTPSASPSSGTPGDTRDGRHGPDRSGGPFHVDSDLADALGVSEEKLEAALQAVREDLAPSERPDRSEPPTEAERAEHRDEFVSALAEELGLSEDKVSAAFEEVQQDRETERRTDLSGRLDDAVDDGDLTEADKESVLKAYDAGVLGGPR